MIEAAMIWNEPNNKSHWDFESNPGWTIFAPWLGSPGGNRRGSAGAAARTRGDLPDRPGFHAVDRGAGVTGRGRCRSPCTAFARLESLAHRRVARQDRQHPGRDASAGLGLRGGRIQLRRRRGAAMGSPANRRTLSGRTPRIQWYSLYDLARGLASHDPPQRGGGVIVHYRHFHMGLLDENGRPKRAAGISRSSRRNSAFANGSISRIIGWMTRYGGCGISASPTCAPG